MYSGVKCQKYFIRVTALVILSIIIINLFNINVYGADTFSDVKSSDYYYEAVQEMADKGYVNGYGDTTFRPKNNITMAESLTLLFRLANYEIPVLEDSPF